MTDLAVCLWFDREAEQAAAFYCSLLPGSRVDRVHRSTVDYPGGREGDVLLVEFTLAGRPMLGLNGGNRADYGTAASLYVNCEDQAEVDRLWTALTADGGKAVQCGWLNDRWGVPWQIVPRIMTDLLSDPDRAKAKRAMEAMMGMVKLDVAALEKAAAG